MAAESHESALGSTRVAIPHGVARERGLVRELRLRTVTGEDHAFLLDTAGSTTPNERANALLERCLDEDDAATLVASLVAGDREALLLQLRRLILGETLDSVLPCAECGEPMELELRVGDLLVDAYEAPGSHYELTIDAADPPFVVRFRLPTVEDVRGAAASANADPDDARAQLLARCVSDAEGNPISDAGAEARDAIEAAMAERDPQAEIELDLTCPSCATPFSIVFDTASFLLQELDARASALFEEVHALALHYHWSEREILAMSPNRRERYITLLADALRSGDAAGYAAT
jgi:hypothetical protein